MLVLLTSAWPLTASEDPVAQLLGPRPDIRDYASHDRFVEELLAWQNRRKTLQARLERGETLVIPDPQDTPDDWHHITGPEDLETAIRNARGYEQPHYKEKRRFNRTTHISFPLPRLQQRQMAEQVIDGTLDDPQAIEQAKQELPERLVEENTVLATKPETHQETTAPPTPKQPVRVQLNYVRPSAQ